MKLFDISVYYASGMSSNWVDATELTLDGKDGISFINKNGNRIYAKGNYVIEERDVKVE